LIKSEALKTAHQDPLNRKLNKHRSSMKLDNDYESPIKNAIL